jgi:peptide/nickel transport system substrate-binding protein
LRHARVWDMLYGVDNNLQPQRQMIESESVSPDGLTWAFRLRPNLKFHDGEPVLAKDAVTSINRVVIPSPGELSYLVRCCAKYKGL